MVRYHHPSLYCKHQTISFVILLYSNWNWVNGSLVPFFSFRPDIYTFVCAYLISDAGRQFSLSFPSKIGIFSIRASKMVKKNRFVFWGFFLVVKIKRITIQRLCYIFLIPTKKVATTTQIYFWQINFFSFILNWIIILKKFGKTIINDDEMI